MNGFQRATQGISTSFKLNRSEQEIHGSLKNMPSATGLYRLALDLRANIEQLDECLSIDSKRAKAKVFLHSFDFFESGSLFRIKNRGRIYSVVPISSLNPKGKRGS